MVYLFIFTFLLHLSCSRKTFIEQKVFVNNLTVEVKTLHHGEKVYVQYCQACHGIKGDGQGLSGRGLIPAPRNFQQGIFKFGLSEGAGLPSDEDFKRIIRYGLKGTGMMPQDLTDQEIFAVTQFIKTFAPQVWEKPQETIKTITFIDDPYGEGKKTFAIKKGKELYHTLTNCVICHKSYITREDFKTLDPENVLVQSHDLFQLKIQETEYFTSNAEKLQKSLPPDFELHPLRLIHIDKTLEEGVYKRIAAGITGGNMPAWHGLISHEEMYAIAYYVVSLIPEESKK